MPGKFCTSSRLENVFLQDIELHRFHPVRTGHREFFDRAAAAAEVRIKQL